MNTDTKSKNFFTVFILIIFIILSYTIVKSFFGNSSSNNNNSFSKDGTFSFVYDKELLEGKILDEMYDDNRTNKVVINKNYIKSSGDINKGKLFIKPSKMEYVFSNTGESPKYYKMTIKKQDYLTLYNLNEKGNKINFLILGSDLKYYKISVFIGLNTEKMDINDKSWKKIEEKTLSVHPNIYYKVIDEKCNVGIELPVVFNEEKYSEERYNELRDKIEESISIEEINDFSSNYYSFDLDNIKINNNVTLLLKDSKIYQYYSKNDEENNISYTLITFIKDNGFVSFSDIDDIDKFKSYLDNNSIRAKEVNYKNIKTYLLYNDSDVSSKGGIYKSILFEIDNHYYLLTPVDQNEVINDNSIESFISNNVSGILEIN